MKDLIGERNLLSAAERIVLHAERSVGEILAGKTLIKASVGATALTALATVSSFLSYVVTAHYFGTSAEMDAYLTASALPVSVFGIVVTGMGMAVVPIMAAHKNHEKELNETCYSLFLLVLGLAFLVGLLGNAFAETIVRLNAPRLDPAKLHLARNLQGVLWVAVGFSMIANFLIGVRHFEKRFLLVAVLPLLPPVCLIFVTVVFAERVGIISLAWGYLAAFLLQCMILAPSAWSWRHRRIAANDWLLSARKFLSSVIPISVSLLIFGMVPVLDVFWCSQLPDGSLSYLGYAFRIVAAIVGITVQGIAIVLFPFLAEHAAQGELSLMGRRLARALRFGFALTIPIACLLTVLRVPVLGLVFQRGRFDTAATQGVAAVLPWYLVGMVGMAATYILARGFYSLPGVKVPAVGGVAALSLYWLLGGLLSRKYSYIGIGVAFASYWILCLILASGYLHRRVGRLWDKEQMVFLLKVLAVSILAAIATHGARIYIYGTVGRIGEVALPGTVGFSTLVLLYCFVFRSQEFNVGASQT